MAYILKSKLDIYALQGDLCQFITILNMDSSQFQLALGHFTKELRRDGTTAILPVYMIGLI